MNGGYSTMADSNTVSQLGAERIQEAAESTALQVVEKQPPRPPPPTSGALAGEKQGAQPTEVAALLRELMHGNVQANLAEGRSK